jgi:hypothetical protein
MMEEDINYRIKEYCGEFTIQIYSYKVKGMLWWKRKEWNWSETNIWGGVWQPYQPFSETFKSLEEAHQQIKDWKSTPVYHAE